MEPPFVYEKDSGPAGFTVTLLPIEREVTAIVTPSDCVPEAVDIEIVPLHVAPAASPD